MNWISGSSEHQEIGRLWSDPETFGTSLIALLIDNYGTEILESEPEVIRYSLSADLGTEPHEKSIEKVMAMRLVYTTDLFWNTWESFHMVCDALNGNEIDMRMWSPISPEDMAWGITEVMLNDPPEQQKKDPVDGAPPPPPSRFSQEVRRYMGVLLQEQGIDNAFGMLQDAEFVNTVNTMPTEPVIHKAYFDRKENTKRDVDIYVKRRFAALTNQIQKLPLRNRDQEAWQRFSSKLPSS